MQPRTKIYIFFFNRIIICQICIIILYVIFTFGYYRCRTVVFITFAKN